MKMIMDAIIVLMICGVLSMAALASGSNQVPKGHPLQTSFSEIESGSLVGAQ